MGSERIDSLPSVDELKISQIEKDLTVRMRQQAAVADLGQRALKEDDLSMLMEETVARIAQTLEVEYVKVLELLPHKNTLLLRAGTGWKSGSVGRATVGTEKNSQAGYTLLSNEPIIVEDLRAESRFDGPQLLHDHGIISGMSVIIQGSDRPFGVLGAHTASRRTFTRDDAYFLRSAANVLAAAIERRQVEDALRHKTEELTALNATLEQRVAERATTVERLFEAAPDAKVLVNDAGTIERVNSQTETLFGYQREELLGQPVEILLPESLREQHPEHRLNYYTEPRIRPMGANLDLYGRRKDGTNFPVDIMLSPLQMDQERLVIAAVRDITERKQAEE
jgi:PAS domain S-box-containing protein